MLSTIFQAIVLSVVALVFSSGSLFAQAPQEQISEAVVVKLIEEAEMINEEGKSRHYQKLELLGTSNILKGKTFTVDSAELGHIGNVIYKPGDKVIVSTQNERTHIITDYVRRLPLYLLFGLFIALTTLIGGRRGVSALIGMAITFALLFTFVLPQISGGKDPVFITVVTSLIVIPITFFLAHGINRKTFSAIIGTFIALIIAILLSQYFINATHLSGFASEEAGFLQTLKGNSFDIKGLIFAGIIIALLGILEDITVSQAAIVFQLKKANARLTHFEIFKSAMDIGRDHIASMANTLILVYAGASLPLLLLFTDSPLPFSTVINYEIIAEEIVRTLVASIALILAVPITTMTATLISETKTLNKK